MTAATPTPSSRVTERHGQRYGLILGMGVMGAALLLIACLLWARYGEAVFFDMLSAGLATCL